MAQDTSQLRITLRKSVIGSCPKARKTVAALGLKRIRQSVLQPDNESIRGMVKAVEYLLDVEPVGA